MQQEQNFPFSKILVGFYTLQRHSLDTLEKIKEAFTAALFLY
jgi:hypothetical protein